MAVAPDIIHNFLKTYFPNGIITLHDYAGDHDHYELTVVDSQFEGLSLVKRHQLIYKALGSMVGDSLHALSVKAFTPLENERKI